MPTPNFTVQDANGIYQLPTLGYALNALVVDTTPASLFGLGGELLARQTADGLKVLAPLPVIMTMDDAEYAVLVLAGDGGHVDSNDLEGLPVSDLVEMGWELS